MTDKDILLNQTKIEVEASLSDNSDIIEIINNKLESNLVAIYKLVTDINMKDSNSLVKVRELMTKQECYQTLKNDYLEAKTNINSIKL